MGLWAGKPAERVKIDIVYGFGKEVKNYLELLETKAVSIKWSELPRILRLLNQTLHSALD